VGVVRLDHIALPVRNWQESRDWYCRHLGFETEFEIPERKTAAIRDSADLTIFLTQEDAVTPPNGLAFNIQVDDVEAKHDELSKAGLKFVHRPMKVFWGYGAELLDPSGYRLLLWDEKSMKQKGGG
jgi:catechol 2,3-dioxygenase-like lactoylglutathione lyase family enzyme